MIVAVIGLGYVGLPLAVEFSKHYSVIGFDINQEKVASIRQYIDPSKELTSQQLQSAGDISYTTDAHALSRADIIVIAVPTPVDAAKIPDFRPLLGASRTAGENMKKGVTIVFESTVYPGATEEVCIPELERASGMRWKRDFFVGYSPERINPGDHEHTLPRITKIVSGDLQSTLDRVAALYETIITAGVCRASSLKVAEAAKVIENTQRDINIGLMNELAIIFSKMGIDTGEVLAAAGTKWNFLPFRPGLVGGHCIGVDPYYLTYKAKMLGYHPEVILSARRINDGMAKFVAEQTIKQLLCRDVTIHGAHVNVLGVTFKENCADIRNSKVFDVIHELHSWGVHVSATDPAAKPSDAERAYGVRIVPFEELPQADAIVLAVAHKEYASLAPKDFEKIVHKGGVIMDVKGILNKNAMYMAGFTVERI